MVKNLYIRVHHLVNNQTKMISVVKQSLKEHDQKAYEMFCNKIATAGDVTTQKRFYMSEYGYSNGFF